MSDFCAFCCREQIGDVYGEDSTEMLDFEDVISYLEELADFASASRDNAQPSDTNAFNEDEAIEIELDLENGGEDEDEDEDDEGQQYTKNQYTSNSEEARNKIDEGQEEKSVKAKMI